MSLVGPITGIAAGTGLAALLSHFGFPKASARSCCWQSSA
jgi:hypothetical protein